MLLKTTWRDIGKEQRAAKRRKRFVELACWLGAGAFGLWIGYWLGRAF